MGLFSPKKAGMTDAHCQAQMAFFMFFYGAVSNLFGGANCSPYVPIERMPQMKMKLSAIVLPSMVTSLLFSCQFATPIASNVDFNNFHNYAKQSQPTPSSTPSASQSYSGDVVAQSTPVPPTSVATPSPYFSQPVDSSPPDKTIESPPATEVLSYGVVSGVVRNQTGTSQGGIEVRLRSLNFSLPFEAITTTNANGEYYFNAVPMGIQVELSATSSQFQPLQQTLVTNRENITYDLMLTAIPTTTIDPPPSDNGNGGKDDFTDTQTGTNNGGESTSPAIVEVPPPVDTTLPPPAQTLDKRLTVTCGSFIKSRCWYSARSGYGTGL
jgi:hypothetical protein